MRNILWSLLLCISCNASENLRPLLPNDYWYVENSAKYRYIESRVAPAKNMIFPTITAYKYTDSYLVAKQIPCESCKSFFGERIANRLNIYERYLKDSAFFLRNSNGKYKEFVKEDSLLYRSAVNRGYNSSNSEYKKLEISTFMAVDLIKNSRYYQQIFLGNQPNYWVLDFKKDSLYGPFSSKSLLPILREFDIVDLDVSSSTQ